MFWGDNRSVSNFVSSELSVKTGFKLCGVLNIAISDCKFCFSLDRGSIKQGSSVYLM